jgi:hypothetical protein
MKVSTTHGDFVVNAISFKDRRELHKLEIQAISVDGQVETGSFYNILEWVMNFAFKNPEKEFSTLDDNQIDEVLMSVYNAYKKPSKKK